MGRALGGSPGHLHRGRTPPGPHGGRLPLPFKAVLLDGGSEFQGDCGEAHRTHGEELYQPKDGELIVRPSPPRCARGSDATTPNGCISPTPLEYLLKSPCGTVRPPLSQVS